MNLLLIGLMRFRKERKMYFSRVEVDSRNRQKLSDLSHAGAYHNWVESAFTSERNEEIDGHRKRHLWRLEELNGKKYLLIVSANKPNLNALECYGVAGSAVTKNYDSFLNNLYDSESLRFKLVANPTLKKAIPGKKQGRVIPVKQSELNTWILNKQNQFGFEIDNNYQLEIKNKGWKQLYHKNNNGKNLVLLSEVTYEGILRITNIKKFKDALISGIGREKAYGFGLLTVAPIKKV